MEENKNISTELLSAVKAIKSAILQSQARTARNVNADVLALNYSVGGYISSESHRQGWGSGAIRTISEQLRKELPGLKGFGYENLKKMRQFYEEWTRCLNGSPTATYLENAINGSPMATQLQVFGNELSLPVLQSQMLTGAIGIETAHDFWSISFSHHMEILNKTTTIEERLFYIRQTATNKWDKDRLRELLKQDLFHHQSSMPNNFLTALPKRVQALKAIEMFKDEYFLDYINVEELGVRDEADVDEKVVENAIVQNVKNFIMMFGNDFAFVGNQYHLEKFGKDHFADLLFFNRELSCLVAVELKLGEFKPIYLGQLQTYLQILDDDVRKPNENPSIGLILCQDVDKSYAEYVIQKYDSPMGVAKYYTSVNMPENLRKALPDIEQLKKLLSKNFEDN